MPFINYINTSTARNEEVAVENVENTRSLMVDSLLLELVSFSHIPLFLFPGIHGHHTDLANLANHLLEQSHGKQKIYIYQDPHFDNHARPPFTSAKQHAQEIVKEVQQIQNTTRTFLPPVLIGFSYGCMLASYVAHELHQQQNQKSYPRLVAIDGGAHALLRSYYQNTSEASLNELLSILNIAARLSGLKPLETLDANLKSQIEIMLTPGRIAQILEEKILELNPSPSDESHNQFVKYSSIINQNLNTITEAPPEELTLPFVYTLFTNETLLKLNSNQAPDNVTVLGGFENNKIKYVVDILDESSPIRSMTHLQLVKDGAADVAKAIYATLALDLDSEKKLEERTNLFLTLSTAAYSKLKTEIRKRRTSSSDEEETGPLIFGSSPPKPIMSFTSPSHSPESPRRQLLPAGTPYFTPQESPFNSGSGEEKDFTAATITHKARVDHRPKNSRSASDEEQEPEIAMQDPHKVPDHLRLFGGPAGRTLITPPISCTPKIIRGSCESQ